MNKRLFAVLALCLVPLAVGVRIWQMAVAIDANGFYLPEVIKLCNGLDCALLALVVVMLLVGRFGIHSLSIDRLPQKRRSLGMVAMLVAIACIPAGVSDWFAQGLLGLVPSVVTAVGFVLFAVYQIRGDKLPFLVSVIPVVGEFIRVLIHYARFNGISRVSQNVVCILFLCSFLAFCLACCRGYSGIDSQKGVGFAYGTAGCTVLFGALSSLPGWLVKMNYTAFTAFSVFALCVALYAAVFLVTLSGNGDDEISDNLIEEVSPQEEPSLPKIQTVDEILRELEDRS